MSLPRIRPEPKPLWRELVGEQLREVRQSRGETLRGIARRASVSPQYLSEVERGLKEPSSEMLEAIGAALDTSLLDLTTAVAERLRPAPEHPETPTSSAHLFSLAA
ncbi:helix-turn-helix domain-containing protein [Herbiconiux sp. P18]|uniref:helix-turn-helix domain-containing protein n=1 Tax=Herbiconiux liangxiaofengii TaxID=3342795 RepID=UPI0035B9CF95